MSNQEEKQKERSQLTSTHKNSMNYLPKRGGGGGGGSKSNEFKHKLLQIQFYRVQ